MYLSINNTARMYMVGVIFLKLPQIIFMITNVIIPSKIPLEIE